MKYITNLMLVVSMTVSGAALAGSSANSASSSNAGAISSSGAQAYTGPQSQGQGQGQQQGQAAYGGNQGQGQGQAIVIGTNGGARAAGSTGALSSGASLSFTDSSVKTYEASDLSKSVPGVFAAGTTAGGSNPCVVSIGGGGAGSGFGFNFSQAYNDGECQIRESVRLMSAIVKGDDPQNQIFLREVTCQSTIYWDAMERTYAETGDMRFYCDNPRPEYGKLEIRDRKHPMVHAKVRADTNISNAPGRSKYNNGFWSE